MKHVTEEVKSFILDQFLPGESSDELTDTTPLITGGILDSLATIKLVTFLEERFSVTIHAHEADVEHLNTLANITALVVSKQ